MLTQNETSMAIRKNYKNIILKSIAARISSKLFINISIYAYNSIIKVINILLLFIVPLARRNSKVWFITFIIVKWNSEKGRSFKDFINTSSNYFQS